MEKELKILIIDDHQMIIDGYKKALFSQGKFIPNIISAKNCDEAIAQLNISKSQGAFDFVLIDVQIPASRNMKYTSGDDIAIFIGQHFKKTKIIILTMIDKSTRIVSMIRKVPHNGILIKSDVNKDILIQAFYEILDGGLYYSKLVNKIANRIIQNDEVLDDKDIRLIYYLSKGVNTNRIPNHLLLSISAVEKRKKRIKIYFNVNNDEELIEEAKKRGYL